jgi:hypothetical protein
MKRSHALLLALLLGVAAVAATFALLSTTSLGISAKAAPATPTAQIAARNAKLDKAEAALRRALRKRPPALPELPKRINPHPPVVQVTAPPAHPAAGPSAATSQPSSGDSDQEFESEQESESDDGGFDD